MVRYFAKRFGMMLVAMFLIILLTFVIMHSIPGGPFTSDRKVSVSYTHLTLPTKRIV